MADNPFFLASGLGIYIFASRMVMRWLGGGPREFAFASLNLGAVYLFFFKNFDNAVQGHVGSLFFAEYLAIVLFQYATLRLFCGLKGGLRSLAFFSPIAILIVIRYLPSSAWDAFLNGLHTLTHRFFVVPTVVGISYMAFRCSRLVIEVQNGAVKRPGIWEYLSFAFFLPTMSLGPINTYANHRRGFETTPYDVPVGRAALRVLVGFAKYQFLGGLLNQLTYTPFLLNGHPHHWVDLPLTMFFYYLYLYCNFSGFCDMAIGAAALIGIPVLENFNNPFAARNIKDFWNRWHITLSQWMRDIVFAPLSKSLVRFLGPSNANHAIALAITVVFLLVGIWHGVGWNFALFGAVHAFGLVANHYYTIILKKRLGRDGFKAYMENRWIHAAAVALTFTYCAASLFFFANSLSQIHEIFKILR